MTHDSRMPKGWHTIKTVLLKEMASAETFYLCELAADALFHARLLGEGCARDIAHFSTGQSERKQPTAPDTRDDTTA